MLSATIWCSPGQRPRTIGRTLELQMPVRQDSPREPAVAVADDDQRGEAEAPATLDDLGDAVDRHHALEMRGLLLRRPAAATVATIPAVPALSALVALTALAAAELP